MDEWARLDPAALLLLVHGGALGDFEALPPGYPAVFVEDPTLRTKDHPRDKQQYLGVMKAASKWLKRHPDITHAHLVEFDVIPLVRDLGAKLIAALDEEDADLIGSSLYDLTGTIHPHVLNHVSDPAALAYVKSLSVREDTSRTLTMLGCTSTWKIDVFHEIAALAPPVRIYLEIAAPTLAHHLGWRVRPLPPLQEKSVTFTGDLGSKREEMSASGAWMLHPAKSVWDQPNQEGLGANGCLAIVNKAKAPYYKPLYEAIADAQPDPWKTLVVWPGQFHNEHPTPHVTPIRDNLIITELGSFFWRFCGKQLVIPTFNSFAFFWKSHLNAIIIHELSPFSLQALIVGKLRRIPVILSTEVGARNGHFYSSTVKFWHRFWGLFIDGIIACSPTAHVPLSGRKIPSVSAYHAMDSRNYPIVPPHSDREGKVIFVFLGQLIQRKGLDLLLDAASILKKRGKSNFLLRFIGAGRDESSLRAAVTKQELENFVEFSGFLSGNAIQEKMRSSDVFVLPTREDTYAAVVHEAACMGLPLLISKFAGASEVIVREGLNGCVFDPYNPESFASHLERLLDPSLRKKMGAESRKIAEEYSAHRRGGMIWNWLGNHGFI